ncbi:hypothetical protein [Streptomyces sp. XY431]|uniref:hypothetical protein n=1 Tax=Streptomyces sp. XY431 TaxID=1415562 RepID=UPI000A533A2E|nr:hypothetical protein [Streptomyces sp. XY431]
MNTTPARLQALVDRVHDHEAGWEDVFVENVPSYDPACFFDQPADDKDMDDWDEIDNDRAFHSRDLLFKMTAELEALIAELEHATPGRPLDSEEFKVLTAWAFYDSHSADHADPDRLTTARLAEAGYLTPGHVPGIWRATRAGHAARAEYTRAHPVGSVVGVPA